MSSSNGAGPERIASYHGQPVLKEPVWTWEIPFYFYTGGLSGASAGLAWLSELRGNEELARRAWAAAAGGIVSSPAFLISDLGKPLRFLNMLRMFKVTSPMSVGSWLLAAKGLSTTVSAANAWLDVFPRLSKVTRPCAALLGLPLSTYTAALITNTAVPAWHEARRELPFVFGAGAALSAGAAATALTPPEHAAAARRLLLTGALLEVTSTEVMTRRLGKHGEPYKRGPARAFSYLARGCGVTGTLLTLTRAGSSRGAARLAGAVVSVGAMSRRWSVFKAGFVSASDPKYTIEPQRTGIERGEREGASRRELKVSSPRTAIGSPATAR